MEPKMDEVSNDSCDVDMDAIDDNENEVDAQIQNKLKSASAIDGK